MKLGFAFKKTKKSGLVATAAGAENGHVARAFEAAPAKKNEAAERVYVTDFDPNAVAARADGDGGARHATLVIPLLKANEWKAQAAAAAAELSGETQQEAPTEEADHEEEKEQQEETMDNLTEDEKAARQLLADVKAQQNDGGDGDRKVNHSLVIPMKNRTEDTDPLAETRAKLFNLDVQKDAAKKKSVPILQQNAVPGMDELEDVTDKYRHDVALRPDELDVHSEAYDSVPIEDFGAAMLRGMGWKGKLEDEKQDADDPKPRQKLLGLGATAKPKLLGDAGKNGHHKTGSSRRTNDKVRTNGLNQREGDNKPSLKESARREDESSRSGREREKNRDSRSRDRDSHKDRDRSSKTSERDGDDRRRDRDRDRDRGRDRGGRDDRDRRDDRGRRDDRDREKRKRSRSRDRSSDRKKSGSRR